MIQRSQTFAKILNMLSDVLLIFLAYPAAVALRFDVLGGVVSVPLTSGRMLAAAFAYSVAVVFLYACAGVYTGVRFRRRGRLYAIVAVNTAAALAAAALLFAARLVDFSRWTLVFLWLLSSLFVLGKHRLVGFVIGRVMAAGRSVRHVAIVGNGRLAEQFVRDVQAAPELGVVVDGYISGVERDGLGERLGSYEELQSILLDHPLDCLVVALEAHETRFMRYVLMAAEREGIRVELIPFYNDYIPTHPTVEVVGRTKMMNLNATPLDSPGWAFVKRTMDVVGAVCILVLTSPVMVIAAVGVKLTSPGPVLFTQERVGRNRRPFKMLKFRSMRADADHTGWTTGADPRKTRFGSVIRKLSIDELPQLFNVLAGHMSLIGPRPELPRYVRQFRDEVPRYLVRQQVRPGMTGWAQIHGLRGDTSIEARVEYDIWYIENWSVGLDLRILLRTVCGGFLNNETIIPAPASAPRTADGEAAQAADGAASGKR